MAKDRFDLTEKNIGLKPWFKIDNAANLYAGARTKDWCRTYRTAVVLDEPIDETLLQQALEDTAKRFPTFSVKLRDGLFWSYLERMDSVPRLVPDTDYPYRPILLEGNDQPNFRILCYQNRVAMEAYHSLSDGSGSGLFLITLIKRYYELKGEVISEDGLIPSTAQEPTEAEARDDYYTYADHSVKASPVQKVDTFSAENNAEKNFVQLIHGIMKADNVKAVASKYSLTVTEYFTAVLIYSFIQSEHEPIRKPISVSVPIDLRKRFPSSSVRNFVYMTDVLFDPKGRTDVSFPEVCDGIRGKLAQKASNEYLLSSISSNVAAQSSPVLRPIPYPFKKLFLKNSYKKSQGSYTLFYSNLGIFKGPDELMKHIRRAESCLAFTPHMHFGCSSVTVNGILTFTFSSSNEDTEKQKLFFRFLAGDGIAVRIESNIHQ